MKYPSEENLSAGSSRALVLVVDLAPTFLELAGTTYPSAYQGRDVVPPIGKSLVPLLAGSADIVRTGEGIGYELFEMKAYIEGGWKLSRMPTPFGSEEWELFDLSVDPGETTNLAKANAEPLQVLMAKWGQFATDNRVFDHGGHFDAIYRNVYGTDN